MQEINYAFAMYTALEKVTLPQSLKSIGMYSFYNCSALKEINFPAGLETIGSDAFDGCKQLETVSLPDSVTKLGEYAFSGCASLKELRLSAGIKQIPEYAFDGCTSLTSVVIPEGVERIGISAFDDSLKTITLPKSLTYVDMNGFAYSDLEKVIYNGTKQEFEKSIPTWTNSTRSNARSNTTAARAAIRLKTTVLLTEKRTFGYRSSLVSS